MIFIFRFFMPLLFLNQCSKPLYDVEFELLNSELYFAPIFSNKKGTGWLYEDYLTSEDKKQSKNILRYRITNNHPFKILFIPNNHEILLLTQQEVNDCDNYGLAYTIVLENNNELENFSALIQKKQDKKIIENYKNDSISYIQDTIRYKNMFERERLKDFTHLEPYQTKIFELELDFPIVNESTESTLVGAHMLPLYKEKEYKFQLHYIQSKSRLEDELPQQILDYLEKNDIRIIDLSLHSEKIPLIPRE